MTKISALSDIGTSVASNDAFVLVDVSDPTTPNKKIQQQNLFLIPDGSAGTPAVRFLNDTDVGLFRPTTNTLALATGGSERLRIDSSGQVGIGTSSPQALFQVFSGPAFGASVKISDSTQGAGSLILGDGLSTAANVGVWRAERNSYSSAGNYLNLGGYSGVSISTGAASLGSQTAAMTIDSSQRVGIGTTSPSTYNANLVTYAQGGAFAAFLHSNTGTFPKVSALSLGSDAVIYTYTTGGATVALTGSAHIAALQSASTGAATDIAFFNTAGGSVSEKARIDSSGRLLVGTSSSPSAGLGQYALLAVQGYAGGATGAGTITIQRGLTAASGGITANEQIAVVGFTDSNGNEFANIQCLADGSVAANDMPGRLVFSTTADGASSPTERMRIDSAGRAEFTCVKDNNAAIYILHNGTNGTQYGIAVNTANDQNDSTRYFLNCTGASTVRAVIRADGGLANYSANNANLSDINTKKDISPAAGTWDCLKEWEIVNYRYKDQPDDAGLNLGVIAQQVAESCPEVITVFEEAKDDQPEKLGVKEQQMYWMAIKALQEAQVRIEALEAEMAAVKAQLS